jgi:hypothetical protein
MEVEAANKADEEANAIGAIKAKALGNLQIQERILRASASVDSS